MRFTSGHCPDDPSGEAIPSVHFDGISTSTGRIDYGTHSTTLRTTFDEAVERTRKAFADQGFGVLTEIDVKSTLKAKLTKTSRTT